MIRDMMFELPEDTMFAFTDGSCLTNPGPCGAGPVLYPPRQDAVPLKRPVCRRGSILLGELVAILIALEHFLQCSDSLPSKLLKIFCDSQSAAGILTLDWKDTSYKDVTKDIRQAKKSSQEKGVMVDISWTPGRASIASNEVADKLAKEQPLKLANANGTPQNKEGHTTHSSPVLTGKECLIPTQDRIL